MSNTYNLYSQRVINNIPFKSGTYVKFTDLSTDIDNLSYKTYINNIFITDVKKFYKLTIYHQLTNGLLDITQNIWDLYAIFYLNKHSVDLNASSTISHWFSDIDFKYYCQSRYKGKLVLSLEIEDHSNFHIVNYPTISLVDTTYNCNLSMIVGSSSNLFKINAIKITYNINNGTDISQTITVPYTSDLECIFPITLTGIVANPSDILYYKIIPTFTYNSVTYNSSNTSDWPSEYLNKYILSGQKVISTLFDDVNVAVVDDSLVCEVAYNGYGQYTKVKLVNKNNISLDNKLSISSSGDWYFTSGSLPNPLGQCLGTYTLSAGDTTPKNIVRSTLSLTDSDSIVALLSGLQIRTNSVKCLNLIGTLDTNFSQKLTSPVYKTGDTLFGCPIAVLKEGSDIAASGANGRRYFIMAEGIPSMSDRVPPGHDPYNAMPYGTYATLVYPNTIWEGLYNTYHMQTDDTVDQYGGSQMANIAWLYENSKFNQNLNFPLHDTNLNDKVNNSWRYTDITNTASSGTVLISRWFIPSIDEFGVSKPFSALANQSVYWSSSTNNVPTNNAWTYVTDNSTNNTIAHPTPDDKVHNNSPIWGRYVEIPYYSGKTQINRILVKDNIGNNIDNNGNVSVNPSYFYEASYASQHSPTDSLGTYLINTTTGKPYSFTKNNGLSQARHDLLVTQMSNLIIYFNNI